MTHIWQIEAQHSWHNDPTWAPVIGPINILPMPQRPTKPEHYVTGAYLARAHAIAAVKLIRSVNPACQPIASGTHKNGEPRYIVSLKYRVVKYVRGE